MRRQSSPPSALHRFLRGRLLPVLAACTFTLFGLPVHSAVVLPNTPLQSGSLVPPNIMFILDDSGSMNWGFMPSPFDNCDFVVGGCSSRSRGNYGGTLVTKTTNISQEAYTRNTIYYNPYMTYQPWQKADGSYMTAPVAPQVYSSTTHVGGDTVNMLDGVDNSDEDGIDFRPRFHVPKGATSDLSEGSDYYRYEFTSATAARRCEYKNGNWNTCSAVVPPFSWVAPDGDDSDSLPDVTNRTIAQELQNFANWYSFHRTRAKVAKAGAGYAFANLSANMRVGFNTIWDRDQYDIPVTSDKGLFRDVGTTTNKSDWYEHLYDAGANNGTPLHSALKRTGEYFKSTSNTGPWGPSTKITDQLTCRQNFAILTTDGFWNSGQEGGNEDNTKGTTHTSTKGEKYGYEVADPYSDDYSGTLADMAMKYWKTDLRTDMDNNVPVAVDKADPAFWQHMVTFGISIGLRGSLNPVTDLAALAAGTLSWPDPLDNEDLHRIDDLWHAAVNGRGKFVAASSPDEFTKGLKGALDTVTKLAGSSSNVSVNGTKIGGGTQVFQASFVSAVWTGELSAFPVDASGPTDPANWMASQEIPAAASRKIFTRSAGVGVPFQWANLTAGQQASLETDDAGTTGEDVLNYLRGDTSKEIGQTGGVFRSRTVVDGAKSYTHLLGDIDHSSPVYVDVDLDGNPATNDTGSSKTVYVGANDGMLHAFDAITGDEQFAYIPAGIDWDYLQTLSDEEYIHQYFVDGEIAVSTREQTKGKNILVGLLGRGGKTVYALDVSSPGSFDEDDVLWEFTDADMGNALGKPVITKLNNGKTGVIIGNGYNSVDGRAVLFILDIETGDVIKKFDTLVGNASTNDNGMATPGGWDPNRNGTFDYLYAGDLLGNVWKFDISSGSVSNWDFSFTAADNPAPFFVAKDADGKRQPITGGITISLNPNTFQRWIFFGTGRYLTEGDPTNRDVQGWYGLIDDGSTQILARSELTERDIVLTVSEDGALQRAFEEATAGDMRDKRGWVLNLETPTNAKEGGERMVTGSVFLGSVLLASSIIPSSDPCGVQGRGYLNFIDPFTGGNLTRPFFDSNGDGVVDSDDTIGDGKATGSYDPNVGMPTMPSVIQNGSKGTVLVLVGGSSGGLGGGTGMVLGAWGRISWREILRD